MNMDTHPDPITEGLSQSVQRLTQLAAAAQLLRQSYAQHRQRLRDARAAQDAAAEERATQPLAEHHAVQPGAAPSGHRFGILFQGPEKERFPEIRGLARKEPADRQGAPPHLGRRSRSAPGARAPGPANCCRPLESGPGLQSGTHRIP
ncbi:MAG: hypothetical protein JWN00_5098 [Actinomycetia bacterium]|nr:hypothetical protein [Actinomycetes bacterium]